MTNLNCGQGFELLENIIKESIERREKGLPTPHEAWREMSAVLKQKGHTLYICNEESSGVPTEVILFTGNQRDMLKQDFYDAANKFGLSFRPRYFYFKV